MKKYQPNGQQLEDLRHSNPGRPTKLKKEDKTGLKLLISKERSNNTEELARSLSVGNRTMQRIIRNLGFKKIKPLLTDQVKKNYPLFRAFEL